MFAAGAPASQWSCSSCKGDPDGDELRRARNCESETSVLGFDWAPELRRCPWSQIDRFSVGLVFAFFEYRESGLLPFPGALAEQPAWLVDAFAVCRNAQRAIEAMRQRGQQAEAERAQWLAERR